MTPNRLTPDAFREAPKTRVRVVLENIRSGLNVGAFFRTGDSLRIDGIEACGLDDDLELIVDRTPRGNHLARSTPELIVRRLVERSEGPAKAVFASILDAF